MAKKIKNDWKIDRILTKKYGDTVRLAFFNRNHSARFGMKWVYIPKSGSVRIAYEEWDKSGGKSFIRKRTKALLEKYRPFKKYV